MFPYFLQTVLMISTGNVSPCGLYILIIFCKQAITVGRIETMDLWLYRLEWKWIFCTTLSSIDHTFVQVFCAFQFVIELLTTLDIKICYRLMRYDLNFFHIWCISFYSQQLLCLNLMNRRFIFFVKWTVMYKSSHWDLSKCDDL